MSAVVILRSLASVEVPAAPGASIYAALLSALGRRDPEQAALLHDGPGEGRLAVSALAGPGDRRGGRLALSPRRPVWVRFASLDDALFAPLALGLAHGDATIRIGRADLVVEAIQTSQEGHAAAARATIDELLTVAPIADHISFRFDSPTFFRGDRHDTLFPQPRLVFRSLSRRLAAVAPEAAAEAEKAMERVDDHVWPARYELGTQVLRVNDIAVPGFMGDVTYRVARDAPAELCRWSAVLAAAARFTGMGAKIAWGFGQCRQT